MIADDDIFGYDFEGNPVTVKEYITDIKQALRELDKGTLETYSTEEVRKIILGDGNPKKLKP